MPVFQAVLSSQLSSLSGREPLGSMVTMLQDCLRVYVWWWGGTTGLGGWLVQRVFAHVAINCNYTGLCTPPTVGYSGTVTVE